MRLRWLGVLLALGFISGWMWGQNTTITGTITDSAGTVWSGATVTASFAPAPNFTGKYTWNGQQMTTFPPVTVVASGSGVFTMSVPDSSLITPANSGRTFTFCPLASVVCNNSAKITVPGPSMDITGLVSQTVVAPQMNPTFLQYGYNDTEILPAPGQGQVYYRTTDNQFRQWNGTAWVNVGGGSGGTGTVIASNQFQVGYYPTPGTEPTIQGVPNNFTTDNAGNIRVRSYDLTQSAFGNQSAPGANDGIRLALQTPNAIVVAGNDYPCTEGSYTSAPPDNYILGIGVPAPFANGTTLINDRSFCGGRGSYAYNPQMGATGNLLTFDRIVANQWPAGPITTFFRQSGTEFTGSGINSGFTSVGPDSIGQTFRSFEIMTRGIQSVDNIEQQLYAGGDVHLLQFQISDNRGNPDVNGEGFNDIRLEVNQNLTPLVMSANACSGAHTCDPTIPTNYAPGATLIQGTLTGNVPFPGDGTYIIKSNGASPVFQILSDTPPGATGTCGLAGQWHVNTTLTPDNIGCVAAGQTTIPIQRYGGTTNATVTITGLTTALDITKSVCVADHLFIEAAKVINAGTFASGTATGVVIALRYPHQPNFYVASGSHACNAVEVKANGEIGSPATRQLFRVIGVLPGNIYLYTRTTFGGWDDGISGYAGTYNVANAGVTLTRNGSGVVTVPVSDGGLALFNASVRVTNCANSTFNSSPFFVITSDTGSAVTWSNPGSATSTTCTKDIEVMSKFNNLFGIRDAQEFPAAEIVDTVDPVTFANDFNLSMDFNTNLHVAAGDTLENHPYADIIFGADRNIFNYQSQTTPSVTQITHFDQISGAIPEGFSLWRVAMVDSPSGYKGLGGSKPPGANLLDMSDTTVPMAVLFLNLPSPAVAAFEFNNCLYGCSDARSRFDLFDVPMFNGTYRFIMNQAGAIVEHDMSDIASGSRTDTKQSPFAWVVEGSNGVNSITVAATLGSFSSTLSGPGSLTSHLTQTDANLSFDKTFTLIGMPDGCAIFATGVLGSTSIPCGNFITSLTTTGSSGPATVASGVLNIPVYAGGGGAVASVFGRTGAVAATSGDYSLSLISGVPGFISVASITVTLPTSSVPANTCTSPATVTMTGVTTSNSFVPTFATDPSAVNGWGAVGGLVFTSWPTTNTLNWEVCNQTASPITPGAMSVNVGVR